MARNCAVIVGINDYDEISPLNFAKGDAERMRDYFRQDLAINANDLYFFTDDSQRNAQNRKTQPTYGTLDSFLTDRFESSFLEAGDTLWFYFSGHGMHCEGKDYLLPSDGNPRTTKTAIPISYVTERLRRSGADNVVMLIDACRNDGAKNAGMGVGEEKQQGVITFFSCSPSQVSYEIETLQQGAFTNVLLEALRIQGEGNCATVERFYQYLRNRVPSLTQHYKNGYRQTPYAVIEPATKLHYILLPKFANLTDITLLKVDALHAEAEGDFRLAFQLWMRVNVAAGGTDMQAINAFQRLANKQSSPKSQPNNQVNHQNQGSKTPSALPVSPPSVPSEFKRESIGKTPSVPTVAASPAPEIERSPQRGEDLRFDLRLSFREALFGGQKTIKISHIEKCCDCGGSGIKNILLNRNFCTTCDGLSLVQVTKKLMVTIPAGVDTGTRLRVQNEGDTGAYCGTVGDLYVYLFVESDNKFKRDGINIRSTIEINQAQAFSGCQLNIDTIDGSVLLTISPKTKSGVVLRLRGRGVPKLDNPIERGDHLVTVNIQSVTPVSIPTEQVEKNCGIA
ncbi:chaperone protein DnaJ [Pseudanabaena sp. lw0831]|uniref:DnaJ C-terminal domain-containing protein n=1 Tax=Pseudanabaena sp. lw0831 TaxID=1357935 RepID=UPI001914E231|nr:DnaJ C-terminal domain-containing protein [Pseudanabaena sp. lw0831]GBO53674.1 chaperone protein DnaJ [Pseudanabaena sp. lw0831]